MKKILIIGKRCFIGNNLSNYLKKFYKITYKDYKTSIKTQLKINNFDYIINTSINKNYIKKKYNSKFDNDLKISNLIENDKANYIFISSRKVYKSKANIKENGKLLPKSKLLSTL